MKTTIIGSDGVQSEGEEQIPFAEPESDQAVSEPGENGTDDEVETPAQEQEVEEIETAPKATPTIKPASSKKKEPDPNPVIEDPYEWHRCTITVARSLLPDGSVSVSVLNHKDEPIVRTFSREETLLRDDIERTIDQIRAIWKDVTITTTLAYLPVADDTEDRVVIISTRHGADTPVVLPAKETEIVLPPAISRMLDELKAALPARAMAHLEKEAKANAPSVTNKPSKVTKKPTSAKKPVVSSKPAPHQDNLKLF